MLQIIIFSFNRAIQLDALLTSIVRHWKSPEYQLDIVYNASSDSFHKGYELLKQKYEYQKHMAFHKEQKWTGYYSLRELVNPYNLKRLIKYSYLRHPKTDFRELTNRLLDLSPAKTVMFMTDDSLFIHDVVIPSKVFDWIFENPHDRQFSLRIGEGMNGQPSTGIEKNEGLLSWNMSKMPRMTNWSYLFSVDAHVYDKSSILSLFRLYNFCNPNSLEGYICNMVRRKGWFGEAKSFVTPHLLSFPINMVQNVEKNETLGVSPEIMNDFFLDGYTLEYQFPRNITMFQIYPDEIYFVRNNDRKTIKTCDK